MDNKEQFLFALRDALGATTPKRFFENERGYQGELLAGSEAV